MNEVLKNQLIGLLDTYLDELEFEYRGAVAFAKSTTFLRQRKNWVADILERVKTEE